MYILDSSVWVALFLDFDTNHDKSIVVFENIDSKIILPYCVLNEVITVLTYKWNKDIANSFLKFIKNNNDIFIENNNIFEEVDFFIWINSKISFTDTSIIKIAKDYWLDLVSFDKQMIWLFKSL